MAGGYTRAARLSSGLAAVVGIATARMLMILAGPLFSSFVAPAMDLLIPSSGIGPSTDGARYICARAADDPVDGRSALYPLLEIGQNLLDPLDLPSFLGF